MDLLLVIFDSANMAHEIVHGTLFGMMILAILFNLRHVEELLMSGHFESADVVLFS